MSRPWPPGSVTGIGSLPGTDPVEAARLVFGDLPDLPHLPELPARGPGADLLGRSAALLVDLPVEIVPSGWRLTARPGHDLRRSRDLLSFDLDAVTDAGEGYSGPLKVQAAGPWTLAAGLELPSGHRAVSDHGATREVAESLAEGLRQHLEELAARLPDTTLLLQLDEPSLPAVLGGRVPTPSGYGTVPAVEAVQVEQLLQAVLEVVPAGSRVVHCCSAEPPIALLRSVGADAISVDAALLGRDQFDLIGEMVDAGVSLWLGVLPALDSTVSLDSARQLLWKLWGELGFPLTALAGVVVPTPACGLAGATSGYARRVLAVLRDLGKAMLDET
jgi:methionine synthase II (cobalamin-independent)